MAEEKADGPRGFGEHARGAASENAQQQGWGLNEDERKQASEEATSTSGGNNYDYGARDFGDEPINMGEGDPGEIEKAQQALTKEKA